MGDIDPVYIHKVQVAMKDGSGLSGYVFWGEEYDETGSFEPGKFLEHWLNHPNDITHFTFFKAIYRIRDNGALHGIAYVNEDKINIESKDVAKIISVPDPYEGKNVVCGFPALTKKEIEIMQSPLACVYSRPEIEANIAGFCYDSKITKKKLNQLLRDYARLTLGYPSDPEKWEDEIKNLKVVFITGGCAD